MRKFVCYTGKEPLIGIYKITCMINGNVYVGQSRNIEHRFYSYSVYHNCKGQIRLYNSLKKYGIENHLFEIIVLCEEHELDELEIFYINLYDCFNTPYGLNLKGGGSNGRASKETCERIGKSKTGIKYSDEYKANMSISCGKGEDHPLYGKPKSDEHKEKLRQANLGKHHTIESILKMSETRKKNYHHMRGKKNIEGVNRMNEARKGKPVWNKGIKMNEEQKIKLQNGLKEYREKIKNESSNGDSITPEERLKRKEGAKKFWERVKQEKLTMIF